MKPSAAIRSFLALAGSSVFAISSASAATLYWDGATPAGLPGGGTGTWDTSTGNWDNTPSADSSTVWVNANLDSAVFGGTAGTVTLGTDITVGGLRFDTTAYTITGATNSKTLTFGAATNNIIFNNAVTAATITGAVTGAANKDVVLSNATGQNNIGTLTLNGTSTGGWSGATTINAGMTLALAGSNQALLNTSGITLNGGYSGTTQTGGITLTNTSAAEAALDRVNDSAAIISNGGFITVTNTASGTTTYAETMGALDLRRGQLNVTQTNANTTPAQTLTFGSGSLTTVNGSARTNATTSAINFSGASLGVDAKNIITITGQVVTNQNEIIAPWATYGNSAGAQNDYAVYNRAGSAGATNALGIQGAAITASAQSTWSTAYSATSNYTLTNAIGSAANGKLSATRIINTVKNTTAATSLAGATVASNSITLAGTSFQNGDAVVFSADQTGSVKRDTVYYVVGASGATFSVAATPGGTALGITGTSGNIIGGISLSSGNNLQTYGILNASGVNMAIGGATSAGVLTTPSGGGNLYLTTGTGGNILIDAPITDNGGAVTVVRNGASGYLILSGNNTFTGGLVVNGGGANSSVRLVGTQSFTGGITLNGGGIGDNGVNSVPAVAAASLNGNAITVNGPSHLIINDGDTLATSSTITINAAGVLNLGAGNLGNGGGGTVTVPGVVSGTGVLDVNANNPNNKAVTVNLTNSNNTFTGNVNFDTGNSTQTLNVNSLGDGGKVTFGVAGGSPTFALNSSATAPLTFNTRQFVFAGSNTATYKIANNSAQSFTINTDLDASALTVSRTLTLGGTGSGLSTFGGLISNGGGTMALSKIDSGTWALTGANTYSGGTTVSAGILKVGSATALGAGGVTVGSGAALDLNGATMSNTNALTISGTGVSNGGALTNSSGTAGTYAGLATLGAASSIIASSGNIILSNSGTVTGAYGLTVGGAMNTTISSIIGTGAGTLTKQDAGTLTLTNTSSYTGATAVSGGTLALGNGGNLGATAVTVGTATLAVTQNASGTSNAIGNATLTLNAGSALNMNDGYTSTLNLGGAATLSSGTGTATALTFNTGASTSDVLAITGAATNGNSTNKTLINIVPITAPSASTNKYTIITAGSGLTTGNFAIGGANVVIGGTVYHFQLDGTSSTTQEVLSLASGPVTPSTAYWQGSIDGSWKSQNGTSFNTNFTNDAAGGTNTLALPGSVSTVYVTGNTVTNAPATLDQAFTITGLVFTGTGTANTVGSTIASGTGGSASTLILGTSGITVQGGSGANTISAPVVLGGAQSWTNSSGNLLTVSGNIDNGANLLTIAGPGGATISGIIGSGATKSGGVTVNAGGATVTLQGSNAYTGTTTVTAGTVKLGNATALGTTAGNTTVASGATLDLNGQTIAEPFNIINGTGVGGNGALINSSATAATISGTISQVSTSFTVGGTGNINTNVVSGSGSWTLTKIGSGTLTLGDGTTQTDNGYLALTLSSGTVILNKPGGSTVHAIGGGGTINNGATLQLGSGNNDYPFYGNNILTVNSGGVYDLNGKNDNRSSATGGTLNLNGTGINNGGALINSASGTTSTISNFSGGVPLQTDSSIGGAGNITISAVVSGSSKNLTKVGAGTLTLTGANTYTGGTTITAGTINLGATETAGTSGPLGKSGTITLNGGTLQYSASVSNTYDYSSRFSTAASQQYNVDTNGKAITWSTALTSSGGSLTKLGGGTLTLSGANTYNGGTTVNQGTLTVGSGGTLGATTGALSVNNTNTTGAATNAILNLTTAVDTTVGSLSGAISTPTSGTNTATINNGGSTRNFTVNQTAPGTYAGVIAGAGNFTLGSLSTNTLTLSGDNSYTGTTTVTAGKLVINGNQSAATGALTVAAGTVTGTPVATLGGVGTIGGNVSLTAESSPGFNNGGVLAPTAAASGTKLSVAGTTTFGAGSIFEWDMSATTPGTDPGVVPNSGSYGQLTGTGAISGGNAVFRIVLGTGNTFADAFWNTNKSWTNVFTGAGAPTSLAAVFSTFSGTDGTSSVSSSGLVTGQGQFGYTGTTLTWTAVPEPTGALAGILLGAGLLRRRRKPVGTSGLACP